MKELFRNVIKAGVIWAAVGALFALAVPFIANAVNIDPASVSVLAKPQWLAPFLGGTAALAVALDPVYNALVGGGKSPSAALAPVQEKEHGPVFITVEQGRDPKTKEVNWQEYVKTERAETGQQTTVIT